MAQDVPKHYQRIKDIFPELFKASTELGKQARQAGPIDDRQAHLIQLAAAVALDSEGAVHSHTRRALQAGASQEEIYHAVVLLVSTVGFPRTAAAISWVQDVFEQA
ncbi:MAG: carboxymuconolactone decarboxylase family protein [Gammaproteobacteria bacterium]|nr:carboxymuconolactone decarboxylase family protein [Gammaproteobacteria bacterium]NIR89058.1 carboxymuconolactone decarboxylase family protein [Gammaproteobacteria bacterium]